LVYHDRILCDQYEGSIVEKEEVYGQEERSRTMTTAPFETSLRGSEVSGNDRNSGNTHDASNTKTKNNRTSQSQQTEQSPDNNNNRPPSTSNSRRRRKKKWVLFWIMLLLLEIDEEKYLVVLRHWIVYPWNFCTSIGRNNFCSSFVVRLSVCSNYPS